jgi:hypothetical protein
MSSSWSSSLRKSELIAKLESARSSGREIIILEGIDEVTASITEKGKGKP